MLHYAVTPEMKLAPNVGSDRSWVWRLVAYPFMGLFGNLLKHKRLLLSVSPPTSQMVKQEQRL